MKSIPFSGAMIRVLPIKTQTRRVLRIQPACECAFVINGAKNKALHYGTFNTPPFTEETKWVPVSATTTDTFVASRYEIGDEVWVREAWRTLKIYDHLRPTELPDGAPLWFLAKPEPQNSYPWGRYRHSRFMPQRFSRYTIVITDVRVQRLWEITEEDALAEGIKRYDNNLFGLDDPFECMGATAVIAYMRLWNHINGQDAWDKNEWLWVFGFEVKK